MDNLTTQQRSALMSRVHSTNTTPELIVRSITHRLGFRYRLHDRQLPGCPDLVFASRRKLIFVHGCFWHGHTCRAGRNRPASNTEYWNAKLDRNMARDRRNISKLRRDGWSVLSIWECQTRDPDRLAKRIKSFLDSE